VWDASKPAKKMMISRFVHMGSPVTRRTSTPLRGNRTSCSPGARYDGKHRPKGLQEARRSPKPDQRRISAHTMLVSLDKTRSHGWGR